MGGEDSRRVPGERTEDRDEKTRRQAGHRGDHRGRKEMWRSYRIRKQEATRSPRRKKSTDGSCPGRIRSQTAITNFFKGQQEEKLRAYMDHSAARSGASALCLQGSGDGHGRRDVLVGLASGTKTWPELSPTWPDDRQERHRNGHHPDQGQRWHRGVGGCGLASMIPFADHSWRFAAMAT